MPSGLDAQGGGGRIRGHRIPWLQHTCHNLISQSASLEAVIWLQNLLPHPALARGLRSPNRPPVAISFKEKKGVVAPFLKVPQAKQPSCSYLLCPQAKRKKKGRAGRSYTLLNSFWTAPTTAAPNEPVVVGSWEARSPSFFDCQA